MPILNSFNNGLNRLGSLFGDEPIPQGGVMGEPQVQQMYNPKLAMATQLLAGSNSGSGFGEIMAKALMAGQAARQMQAQHMQQQRQLQIEDASKLAAMNKLERVDLGDSIGLLDASGNLVGKLPKSASPDAQLGAGVQMRGQDLTHESAIASDLTARYGIDKTAASALASQMVQMRGQDMNAASDQAKLDATTGKQRPLTEYDRKARLLFSEMQDAAQQYDAADGGDTSSVTGSVLNSNPVTRPLASSGYKQHEAAGLRWAQNFLYLKSGQSAPAEEVRKTFVQYLPQPGDGDVVKEQKRVAREQALQNVANANNIDYAPPSSHQPGPGDQFLNDIKNRVSGYYNANGR
jgi:hypothetical protein